MCGIFGYFGNSDANEIILEGLKRLEYRGYDSFGVAVNDSERISLKKKTGKIGDLKASDLGLNHATKGIGHTRWATHGGVTVENAHPHYSSDQNFALAQNGIVQNYDSLKKDLVKKGYNFISQTDTEVIVRLVEEKLKIEKDLFNAVRSAFLELEGRNTIILLSHNPECIIAARFGSPLIVGKNTDSGEIFFSSDTLSFASQVNKILVIENMQMIKCENGGIELYDIKSGEKLDAVFEDLDLLSSKIDKEGYDHFMIKEINEIPYSIRELINQPEEPVHEIAKVIKNSRNVFIIGSGTAGVAACQMAFYLREYSQVNAVSLVGADSADYFAIFAEGDVIVALSQSGETADVLEVLEIAKEKGVKIVSFVNMSASTMTRMSDYKFMALAGPEIAVVSTKIFASQIAWGYLVAKTINGSYHDAVARLKEVSMKIEEKLKSDDFNKVINNLTNKLKDKRDIFLLGKAQNFQIMREGMVKLMGGAYKHSHAIPAGDLKHYAITLMEIGIPVIICVSNDNVKSDVLNAANQVKARGAEVIGIACENDASFDVFIEVPDLAEVSAIFNVVPLQLLAYNLAVAQGIDIDKPRNIAKSSTVK